MQRPPDGRQRVVIEDVTPQIESGRFAIKRTVGELVRVRAAVFGDGHDSISGQVVYRFAGETDWQFSPLLPTANDCWEATFRVSKLGRYLYTVEGWVDRFKTWRADLKKRIAAGQSAQALPSRIRLTVGLRDLLILRNDDDQPQSFGPVLLAAGQTYRLPFSAPATFDLACSAHSAGRITIVVAPEPMAGWHRLVWRFGELLGRWGA